MKIKWGRKSQPEARLGRTTTCDVCAAEVSSEGYVVHWLRYHDTANLPARDATEFEVVIVPLSSDTPAEDQIVVPCRDRRQAVEVNDEIHRREPHTFRTTIRGKLQVSS